MTLVGGLTNLHEQLLGNISRADTLGAAGRHAAIITGVALKRITG